MAPMAMAQDETTVTMIQCGDALAEGYDGFIKEWEENNPGYKVDVEIIGWSQCQEKITTLAAAGTPVGLAYVGSRTLKQFAENDLIVPVPMSEEEKASYYPNIVSTVTYDGTQWGVPVAFSTKALYWNKDLFEEAGLDPETPPKTWQELYDMAATITEKTAAAGYGLSAKTFDNTMHQYLHWVYTNNGKVTDENDEIVLDSPQNLEALTWYGKMVDVAQEGPTAYEQDDLTALFNDSKVAMIQQGPWVRVRLDEGLNWDVAPLPLGPQAEGPGTLLITDSLAVFKGTGYEEQAIDLAKWLTNPEHQFFYEKTHGLTPLRPVAGVEEMVAEDPTWGPFLDGISHGGPEPLFTDYKAFQNAMIDMVQAVVTGNKSPEDALKDTAEEIDAYK
ncbi:sugar ABC transporter substrate-binding protein [Chelativorans sp. EGI FJ00035]|uniref:Sugar ABC transporter substrate-binding protein n=2 Tax=Chelativorans salis TaxID=2978478 RepID=A0ABT2LJF3_9HYPH|nr:sugar ABC transporter substrate-binding protein [Chelativorans sp. EGI FJ00035]MCT7374469.1 sugar ABC transporter substrate-binding protein [Chelativorans sp. EGI FJ00035]